VGYYAPGLEPQVDGGNTLILAHTNLVNEAISDKLLLDDTIIEVDWQGNVVWEWRCSDHFHELGFDDAARTALYNNPNMRASGGGMGDWMHINSMSALGPNNGMTPAMRVSIPTTLSGTPANPTLSPLSINRAARSSGSSARTTANRS
jgi:hypothetical protein